ncbi:MAG: hypothetical protein ACRD9R_16815, partial [Pyrinomonadaceae bacterium]
MRRIDSLGMCLLLLTGVLISISAETTCAQDAPSETQRSIRTVAEKFDEYGKVGHCDMSARLDNFAISLMNEPEAKGFIISFDPQAKKYEHAERSLRIARHYLINTRGIAAERIITIHGGSRDVKEEVTELWMGAEGAAPPITPSSKDKYSATDFSGLFSSYTTDERIYREVVELGYSAVDIAHSEFAEKLKQQPDSVGYLLIRTSKNSPAGGWPRIARRDEQILHKGHSVGTERLTSINGGRSDGEYTLVELWVVPKSSAPPVGVTDEAEAKLSTAIKLNTYETFGGV